MAETSENPSPSNSRNLKRFPVGFPIGISSNGDDSHDMGILRVIEDLGDTLLVKGMIEGEPWEGTMGKDHLLEFDEQLGRYTSMGIPIDPEEPSTAASKRNF